MNKFLVCVIAACVPSMHLWSQQIKPALPEATVYYALDSKVIGEGKRPDAGIVRRMVDSLVVELTNQATVADAWRSLVSPADVVGIKVSTSAGILGGTREAVASAIAA